MRSESTSAFGQPSETNEMRGARFMVGSKLVGLSYVDPGAGEAPEPGIYNRKAGRIFIKLGAIRAKRRSAAKKPA
jgi:hypothetical protein